MLSQELLILNVTALSMGLFHTLIGPDHYLPFIVMAKAKRWSFLRTMLITFLCGIGHVLSSVVLGLLGIALGVSVTKLVKVESFRGNIAAWAMIAFGLVYCVWGLHRAIRRRPHKHQHDHVNDNLHEHTHVHTEEHLHVHEKGADITPWVLFTIFVFGPCEPLIPLVMYPAAKGSCLGVILVAALFGVATIITMMGIVIAAYFGIAALPLKPIERYSHALAGAAICICGLTIQLLGL